LANAKGDRGNIFMIRVLIVATAAVARAGLSAALSIDPGICVVGTIADLDPLVAAVDRTQPDVLLLDLGDSPQNSVWDELHLFQATRSPPGMPIALYDWEGDLTAAMRVGVTGILPATSTERELGAAIIAIASGWLVFHPTALELLDIREKVADPIQILTPRELEVLVQMGAGLGNKAIAHNLHISEHTVKFHISSIFQKLAVSTRTEAVTAGVRMGAILL
jgi:two-component system, NarL family, response regulator YdfI